MIKIMIKFLIVLGLFFAFHIESQLNAQTNDNQTNTSTQEDAKTWKNHYIGINILHPIVVSIFSISMNEDVFYLPVHISYAQSFNENWGISALFLYRYEKDSEFMTREFGFAIGPRLSFNHLKGLYFDCKFGLGYAWGVDYSSDTYSRLDFVIEPELGFNLKMSGNYSITLGVGTQTLLPLKETPSRTGRWDWNELGVLSHYALPVLNLSLAVIF